MSPYRTCIDCPAPVKLGHRDRCHVCHRRAERDARKRSCTNCLQLRYLGPGDVCASCVRAAAPPKAPKTIRCISCDQQRRNVGHGLCNRCNLADLDRPFNYAAAQARKMSPVPGWWNELTAFVAARHHPGGAVAVLRATGRLLAADPTASPHRLLTCSAAEGPTNRALTAFFISRGLALSGDSEQRGAAQRRARYLDAVPAALAAGVAAFTRALLDERERARRRGRRPLSDITVETKLRILRDLATSLTTLRHVTGWAEIATSDLEDWIAKTPTRRHQLTYVLRGFFAWAKNAKLVLVDPTGPLRLSVQPAFNGAIIDTAAQRTLLRRWTTAGTHPHERLVGLLALLHAASNAPRSAHSSSPTSIPSTELRTWPADPSQRRSTQRPGPPSTPRYTTAKPSTPSTPT